MREDTSWEDAILTFENMFGNAKSVKGEQIRFSGILARGMNGLESVYCFGNVKSDTYSFIFMIATVLVSYGIEELASFGPRLRNFGQGLRDFGPRLRSLGKCVVLQYSIAF